MATRATAAEAEAKGARIGPWLGANAYPTSLALGNVPYSQWKDWVGSSDLCRRVKRTLKLTLQIRSGKGCVEMKHTLSTRLLDLDVRWLQGAC
jgi:hypothetical protein